jgi:hypothetical protein
MKKKIFQIILIIVGIIVCISTKDYLNLSLYLLLLGIFLEIEAEKALKENKRLEDEVKANLKREEDTNKHYLNDN